MTRRLFVSVDLPNRLAEPLETLQDEFREAGGLTFTDPTQAHVTLKFLGDTSADRIESVTEALRRAVADADTGPFTVEVGGLGVFPSTEYVRVLWAGVREGSEPLTRLHEAVERETTQLGFDTADHEFTPHVTLARMRDARGKELVTRLVETRDPTIGRFEAEAVHLTESHISDDGSRYETVASVEL